MKRQVEAIFKMGVFWPLEPIQMDKGQKRRILVESPTLQAQDEILGMAYQVYDGLTPDQIREVESI